MKKKPAIDIITTDEQGNEFTAETFLHYIRPSHPQWWEKEHKKWETQPAWIFRGVSDEKKHGLLPSGLRDFSDDGTCERKRLYESISDIIKDGYFEEKEEYDELTEQPHMEMYKREPIRYNRNYTIREGMAQFHNTLRDFGYDIKDSMDLLYRDKKLWKKYYDIHKLTDAQVVKSAKNEEPRKAIKKELETWALAQHHGIPTYLLDWTRNPLIAAFFACDKWEAPNPKAETHEEWKRLYKKQVRDIAVWALHWDNWKIFVNSNEKHKDKDKLELAFHKLGIISTNAYNNPYLKAQKGVFTWIAGEYDAAQDRWLGVHEILKKFERKDKQSPFLKKIILKGEYVSYHPDDGRERLKQLIFKEGITKAAMMPTLDNIAHTVKSRW